MKIFNSRFFFTILTIFFSWAVINTVVHGYLLENAYLATVALWRPVAEMNMALLYLGECIFILAFASIYSLWFAEKNMPTAVKYGFLLGIGSAAISSLGSYVTMPIPATLALAWFVTGLVKMTIGGAILGAFLTPKPA